MTVYPYVLLYLDFATFKVLYYNHHQLHTAIACLSTSYWFHSSKRSAHVQVQSTNVCAFSEYINETVTTPCHGNETQHTNFDLKLLIDLCLFSVVSNTLCYFYELHDTWWTCSTSIFLEKCITQTKIQTSNFTSNYLPRRKLSSSLEVTQLSESCLRDSLICAFFSKVCADVMFLLFCILYDKEYFYVYIFSFGFNSLQL